MLGLCKMNHVDNVDRDHNNSNKTENTTMIMTTMVMMMITAVMMETNCRFNLQASGAESAYWDKCAKGKKQPTYCGIFFGFVLFIIYFCERPLVNSTKKQKNKKMKYSVQSGSSAVQSGSQPTIVVKAHAPGNGCYMVVFNNGC